MNIKYIIVFSARLILIFALLWILNLSVTGAALEALLNIIVVLIYFAYTISETGKTEKDEEYVGKEDINRRKKQFEW